VRVFPSAPLAIGLVERNMEAAGIEPANCAYRSGLVHRLAARRREMRGHNTYIYLIRQGLRGPIKIGKSDIPRARLTDLQIAHSDDLHLLCVFRAPPAFERALHAELAESRIRGEWFAPTPDVLGAVDLLRSYGHRVTRGRGRS
jgi:hypothetical protein